MFELSSFYKYCTDNDVAVLPMPAPSPGVTVRYKGDLGIILDFHQIHSTRKLKGVCCHEAGHAGSGALHKVDSPYELAERSEYRANKWSAEHFMTADDFRNAFRSGARELWELADYFDLPEEDVQKALQYWTEQRGIDFNEEVSA